MAKGDAIREHLGPERPVILMDLNHACEDLGLLLFSASKWSFEEDWQPLADEVRVHLRAAMDAIERFVEKNRDLIALHHEDGLDEVLAITRACLRKELSGRSSIGPGSAL